MIDWSSLGSVPRGETIHEVMDEKWVSICKMELMEGGYKGRNIIRMDNSLKDFNINRISFRRTGMVMNVV
jgi:hypothetical protein